MIAALLLVTAASTVTCAFVLPTWQGTQYGGSSLGHAVAGVAQRLASTADPGLSGWIPLADGRKVYFDPETHRQATGWTVVDGTEYCFADDGGLVTGWAVGEDGRARWMREDGTMAVHELVEIDGEWQAFGDDGAQVTQGEVVPPNDAENVLAMSARQRAVVEACDETPWPGKALCAGWVSNVFSTAGEGGVGGNACDIADTWCTSADLADLRPGMVIAVPSHSRTENGRAWGHVGIYVGGGYLRDSGSYGLRKVGLGTWFAWFGDLNQPKWGWANGVDLSA